MEAVVQPRRCAMCSAAAARRWESVIPMTMAVVSRMAAMRFRCRRGRVGRSPGRWRGWRGVQRCSGPCGGPLASPWRMRSAGSRPSRGWRRGCQGRVDLPRQVVDTAGGVGAGWVAVEGEGDAVGGAAEGGEVVGGDGGAADGDGVGDAGLVGGEGVGVALDHHGMALFDDAGPGVVVGVQELALAVQGGFGGVEVLGAVAVDEPAGEPDRVPLAVVDGEDEPAPHGVVEAPGAGGAGGDPGGERFLRGEAVFAKGGGEGVPSGWGVAELELFGDGVGEAPVCEVGAGRLPLGPVEPSLVVADGLLENGCCSGGLALCFTAGSGDEGVGDDAAAGRPWRRRGGPVGHVCRRRARCRRGRGVRPGLVRRR